MPHWACHYYRLETNSSFVVGNWDFTRFDSAASLVIYSALIAINLIATVRMVYRPAAAILSGILHVSIGALHAYRLVKPFRFEVFGHAWPLTASLREALIVVPFGLFCLWIVRQK
jgi:hypothetical protein